LNEILTSWEITDKEADLVVDVIKVLRPDYVRLLFGVVKAPLCVFAQGGLEDASVRAREISRFAYLNIYQMFPRKAEKIKASLHSTLRTRYASDPK
jgi:hypothetical protein